MPKKIKVGAYVINLDEYANIEAHWIGLYVSDSGVTYFYSFGVEHIPKVIQKYIGNKNMQANIFRIQANNSITCGSFCIWFIDFMLAGKTLINYASLFSPYDFEKITIQFWVISKMDKALSMHSNSNDEALFRLNRN